MALFYSTLRLLSLLDSPPSLAAHRVPPHRASALPRCPRRRQLRLAASSQQSRVASSRVKVFLLLYPSPLPPGYDKGDRTQLPAISVKLQLSSSPLLRHHLPFSSLLLTLTQRANTPHLARLFLFPLPPILCVHVAFTFLRRLSLAPSNPACLPGLFLFVPRPLKKEACSTTIKICSFFSPR